MVNLGIADLEPWYLLGGSNLQEALHGSRKRHPARKLIPFARRQDNDDIACWEIGTGDAIQIIHDFASPGWEQKGTFPSFYDWLRSAIQDLIDFDYGNE